MTWRVIWLNRLRVRHQTAEYEERNEAGIEYGGE